MCYTGIVIDVMFICVLLVQWFHASYVNICSVYAVVTSYVAICRRKIQGEVIIRS